MSILSWAALGWVGWGCWQGYKRGLIKVVANVIGLVLAYVACFLWAWPLSKALAPWVSPAWQWPAAGLTIFMAASLLLRLIALPLSRRFPAGRSLAIAGAVGNSLVSIMMLATLLWGLSFMAGSAGNPALKQHLNAAGVSPEHPLVNASHWLVSRILGMGLSLMGGSDTQVQASVALAEKPAESLQSIQGVMASPVTKQLMANPALAEVMREGDVDAIRVHPDFVAFQQQPGMAELQSLMPESEGKTQDAALAETMVTVWTKVDAIKHSPAVQTALSDPEVQKLMQAGDSAALMAHPKMQPIVGAVMSGVMAPAPQQTSGDRALDLTSTQVLGTGKPSLDYSVNQSTNKGAGGEEIYDVMYKWFDGSGRAHFSTWDRIPAEHRDGAELIHL